MFGILLACISKNDIESCFKDIFYEFSCSKEAEACIKPAIKKTQNEIDAYTVKLIPVSSVITAELK